VDIDAFYYSNYEFLRILAKKRGFSNQFYTFIEEVRALNSFGFVDHIFESVNFWSRDKFANAIYDFAEFFVGNYSPTDTLICATAGDRSKDSSQDILYALVSSIGHFTKTPYKTCSRYDQSPKLFKENKGLRKILLVDEFFGSGVSALGRARTTRKLLAPVVELEELSFFALVCHANGYSKIKSSENINNFYFFEIIEKSIRSVDKVYDRSVYYYLNFLWCRMLSLTSNGHQLHDLGYGDCEGIYYREDGNCPNNVLPILWWPEDFNGVWRKPIFPRSM